MLLDFLFAGTSCYASLTHVWRHPFSLFLVLVYGFGNATQTNDVVVGVCHIASFILIYVFVICLWKI